MGHLPISLHGWAVPLAQDTHQIILSSQLLLILLMSQPWPLPPADSSWEDGSLAGWLQNLHLQPLIPFAECFRMDIASQ